MTKINNVIVYEYDENISDGDFVIGSDADTSGKITKNYKVSALRDYILSGLSPELGGTLKIAEVIYNGELYSESFQVANALNPAIEILQYNIVIFTINGDRYLLKSQNVTIGTGQDPLDSSDFITLSSYEVLGDGTPVWKGYNSTTKKHEIYSLTSEGIEISIEQVSGAETGNIKIEKKAGINLGGGIPFYKGRNATTFLDEHYTAGTNSLSIQKQLDEEGEETGVILFDIIEPTDIPRFIVNSASQSEEETGTLSKPFKTIQGALNAFVGTGEPIAPQFPGSEIIIQKGIGYTFTGNISYNSLTIILEESTTVTSIPSSGINFLCDFDTLPNKSAYLRVILKDNSQIILQKSGFRNSGTTVASFNYSIVKTIEITGTGRLIQSTTDLSPNIYKIFESNFTSSNTFNNDGAGQIKISGISLSARTQSLYSIGGNSRFIINGCTLNIDGAIGLSQNSEFFNQIGGTVRINNSMLYIVTSNYVTLNRIFPISRSASVTSLLIINGSSIEGNMLTLFENTSSLQPRIQITGVSTDFFNCVNTIKSPLVYWTNAILNNNVFISGSPDFSQVDLTAGNSQSVYNTFNSKLNESLSKYTSRAEAVSIGLKKGDKFINTSGVSSPTTGWFIDMIM